MMGVSIQFLVLSLLNTFVGAMFELPALLYEPDALEPFISEETLFYHYGKHHKGYVDNLNRLVNETHLKEASLFDLVMRSEGEIYNNAAQVLNHNIYWLSMTPDGAVTDEKLGRSPTGGMRAAITDRWGDFKSFKDAFVQVGLGHFGSGYVWLVVTDTLNLEIVDTHDASNPLREGYGTPLLCCDIWEHAYYVDRRNSRKEYIEAFFEVANWDYATFLYERVRSRLEDEAAVKPPPSE